MSQFTGLLSATGLSSMRNLGVVAAADVTPNAVNWADISGSSISFSCDHYSGNNPVQITGIDTQITLRLDLYIQNQNVNDIPPYSWGIYYKKSSSSFSKPPDACTPNGFDGDHITYGYTFINTYSNSNPGTITVDPGDYLAFVYSGPAQEGENLYIRNVSNSNATLDSFFISVPNSSGCVLTTAVVSHMGLADDGPELTAMRSLREHYKNISGYQEIIDEYYQNSRLIIDAINQANAQETEYQYIYSTVVGVMNHVNNQEWQQAHDLYMEMYNNLKNTYLGM